MGMHSVCCVALGGELSHAREGGRVLLRGCLDGCSMWCGGRRDGRGQVEVGATEREGGS